MNTQEFYFPKSIRSNFGNWKSPISTIFRSQITWTPTVALKHITPN